MDTVYKKPTWIRKGYVLCSPAESTHHNEPPELELHTQHWWHQPQTYKGHQVVRALVLFPPQEEGSLRPHHQELRRVNVFVHGDLQSALSFCMEKTHQDAVDEEDSECWVWRHSPIRMNAMLWVHHARVVMADACPIACIQPVCGMDDQARCCGIGGHVKSPGLQIPLSSHVICQQQDGNRPVSANFLSSRYAMKN
eukprot:scaffold161630_cov17-Tisochrysis_lutea.AAC.3